jgi:hypothetical protein
LRLSVVTLGHVHTEDLVALTPHFDAIEQLVLDVPPRDPLDKHRAELNRAIDAATTDWILIVREREVIDEPLAKEIVKVAGLGTAWGFRIRAIVWYAGKPLRIGRNVRSDKGELRLVHRRHLLRRGELAVQGTVVRIENALRSVTFASAEEHRAFLAEKAAKRSTISRAFVFARYVIGTRAFDANTLRYLWIEAGFEVSS